RLDTPYRMVPELAAFLSGLLFEGQYRSPASAIPAATDLIRTCCSFPVEFVPVPGLSAIKNAGKNPKTTNAVDSRPVNSVALPRSGAGLELDLAVARGNERLPAELRARLPNQGFANYLEAQAVVRTLENLADDAKVLSAHKEHPGCPVI